MKTYRLLSYSLLTAVALGGCNKQTGSGNSGKDANGKKMLTVGFSQIGAESAWRTAETASIKDEAAKAGVDLKFSDAQQKQENQIKALNAFVAQGVDVIALAPVIGTGWESVLNDIKQAGIPVILVDRMVKVNDPALYATYIGPDTVEEGRKAGRWLAEKTNGKANIAELEGTPGAGPAIDRGTGFREAIEKSPDMHIIMHQSGDFTKAKGKEVMEAFLRSPEGKTINALYAHNDDMALGAIQAIEEAGLQPGKDIIIVSIDGEREAFNAMVAGKENCSVECNPLMGPQLFEAAKKLANHEEVPKHIVTTEGMFDQTQAAAALPSRKY